MKRFFAFALAALFIFAPMATDAYVSVQGYYRKDGTYVRPHVRSNPNGVKYDNYSYTPSQGLYNDTYGTRDTYWDTPTYYTDPDYYEGQAIYNSGTYSGGTSGFSTQPIRTTSGISSAQQISCDSILGANAHRETSGICVCDTGYHITGTNGLKCELATTTYTQPVLSPIQAPTVSELQEQITKLQSIVADLQRQLQAVR